MSEPRPTRPGPACPAPAPRPGRPRWRRAPSTAPACSSPAAAPAWARPSPSEFARLGAVARHRQPQGRAPRRRPRPPWTPWARPALAVALRHPRARRDRGRLRRAAEARSGCRRVLVNNAAANFPVPGRGHVAQRLAHGGRHHPQRHVLLLPRVRPPAPGRGHARLDRQHRRVLRVDRRPRLRPLGRGQGRGQEPDRVAGRRVGPLRDPGQRPRARPVPPRGHDRRHPGQPGAAPTTRTCASPRCGWASARSWAGPPPSWPRPTPGSSPGTPSSSTAPTGSGAA